MRLISKEIYFFLYAVLLIVIGFGLLLPLMENDSAQHASMALRMSRENDFFSLFKGEAPYLDKPHMHFWLSGLSFEILGKSVIAYRLPAVLLTLFSGYAVFSLTNLLYQDKEKGRLATLFYLTSQTIILSLHDVRTDAVLTSFVILAIWQWTQYLEKNKMWASILGGMFTAFAYSTKGLVAIAIIGLFLFLHVFYKNYWSKLLKWKTVLGIISFILFSVPMWYAYYHQFGAEGIRFITLGQSAERFSGGDFGTASRNDYFFYFHTALWALLPWSLWFYISLFNTGKSVLYQRPKEIASFGTVLIFMIVMNFSQFKLPHYINPIVPLICIFTANKFAEVFNREFSQESYKPYQWSGYFIAIVGSVLLLLLSIFIFPINNVFVGLTIVFIIGALVYLWYSSKKIIEKLIIALAGFALVTNLYLNSTFYNKLMNEYQANTQIAKFIDKEHIPHDKVFVYNQKSAWALDWELDRTTPHWEDVASENLLKPYYIVVSEKDFPDLNALHTEKIFTAQDFRITKLSLKFLNPKTRDEQVGKIFLLKIF